MKRQQPSGNNDLKKKTQGDTISYMLLKAKQSKHGW